MKLPIEKGDVIKMINGSIYYVKHVSDNYVYGYDVTTSERFIVTRQEIENNYSEVFYYGK